MNESIKDNLYTKEEAITNVEFDKGIGLTSDKKQKDTKFQQLGKGDMVQ